MGKKQKQKVILPPELPPEITEDEVEVSDEDLQFVQENRDYAGLISTLDTQSITKSVSAPFTILRCMMDDFVVDFIAFNSILQYDLSHVDSKFYLQKLIN